MAINKAMNDIEAIFETRRSGPLKEYIGCSYAECTDGSKKMIQLIHHLSCIVMCVSKIFLEMYSLCVGVTLVSLLVTN
jgi:hypothetical protein